MAGVVFASFLFRRVFTDNQATIIAAAAISAGRSSRRLDQVVGLAGSDWG